MQGQWSERAERDGWTIRHTTIGGSLPGEPDPFAGLPNERAHLARAAATGALLAVTRTPARTVPADVAHWAAVVRKLVQRGESAPVPPRAADIICRGAHRPPSPTQAVAALSTPAARLDVDGCVAVHPTYERPFLYRLAAAHPNLARWITPQAPLDALRPGAGDDAANRFVDFLIAAPWMDRPVVVELDGSQHAQARHADADRDRILRAARVRVERHPGPAALDASHPLWARLAAVADAAPGPVDPAVRRWVLGPAVTHRLAVALTEAVLAGLLPAGAPWCLDLRCDTGVAGDVLGAVLDLLRDVADVWNAPVVPDVVTTPSCRWVRRDGRYEAQAPASEGTFAAHVTVYLQTTVPAAAPLPQAGPAVVVRGVCVPAHLGWLPAPQVTRRAATLTAAGEKALTRLLHTVLGHPQFRPGQLRALRRVLAGNDAVVLLPTGAGKSAVYMLAGMLQPGVTVVVAPITGLIDDQERRLRAHGITRVAALHAARTFGAARDRLYTRIASGDTLVALVTPERLQTQTFREQLAAAAATALVNLAVVDEAHCVSEWGFDFRTSYLRLGANLRRFTADTSGAPPPLLALTGTASPAVLRDVVRELGVDTADADAVQRPEMFDRPNLTYDVRATTAAAWRRDLADVLTRAVPEALACDPATLTAARGAATTAGVVFTPHAGGSYGVNAIRNDVVAAATRVPGAQPAVDVYSGGRPGWFAGDDRAWADRKAATAAAFHRDDVAVLVATKAFGMGIDKPNIRWTLHVGMPASIEAFAQEAGRAGRDGAPARCTLLAIHPHPARAAKLLDPSLDPPRRAKLLAATAGDDDLTRQLFFLTRSFSGASTEYATTDAVLTELETGGGPDATVVIARGQDAADAVAREKALYRLSLAGVVADWTVDFGAATFTVTVAPYTTASVDEALLEFVDRVEPNRSGMRRAALATAPAPLSQRVRAHLRTILDILYATIEPARVRALAEMYALTVGSPPDAEVRARIAAYLHEGPLAGVLSAAVAAATLDLPGLLRVLDTIPAVDAYEWVGAAGRQLERAPDHPLLLVVRALGEALLPDGDRSVFTAHLREAFAGLDSYGVSAADALLLARWTCAHLRNAADGRRWAWTVDVYAAWDATRDPAGLIPAEDQVLAAATTGRTHPHELAAVLRRRATRLAAAAAAYTVTAIDSPSTDKDHP